MIQKPFPENPKQLSPTTTSPSPKKSRRGLIIVGSSFFLFTVCGGLAYLKFFLQEKLTPIIETELSDLLNRPVTVGELQGFSPNSLRFGESAIPATDDLPEYAQAEGVIVNFDLWSLITSLDLNLDVTLVKPKVYLEEDRNGRWLKTVIDKKTETQQALTINLEQISFDNTEIILVARDFEKQVNPPVRLEKVGGKARFFNEEDKIDFSLKGQVIEGGKVKIDGVMKTPENPKIDLRIKGQNIAATGVSKLSLAPLTLTGGKIDADLAVNLKGNDVTGVYGAANIHNVNAEVEVLPASFSRSNGKIKFNGFLVELDGVQSTFGSVPSIARGIIDTKGQYAIKAQTAAVKAQDVIKTLKIPPLPMPISGEIKADIEVKGDLDKPVVKAQVVSSKNAKIDKIDFKSVRADLELIGDNLAVKRIDLLPTVGGVITGQGRLKLPESPSNPNHKKQQTPAVFSFVGKNIPARVIARSYNITLPLDPGLVSGDTKLSGFLSDANSIRATGRAYFSFGGGIVRAENLSYYGGKWQTNLQSSGVKLASLPNIPCDNLSPEICSGGLNANLNLQGDIEQTTLDTITASGEAQLNTKVGTFLANQVQLNQGNWQTNLQAQQVKIAGIPNISCSGFMAQFCQGKLEGNFKIAGNLASLEPEKIVATGAAKVNTVAGSFYAHNLQLKEGKWQTNVEANQVKVARLIPDLPLRNPALNVQINLAGSLVNSTGQNNQTAVNNIVARGSGNLSSADGSVTANSISLQQGNFQAIVTAQNLHLAKFSPELKGTLKGRVNIAGNINNLNPRDVKLEGRLDFSRGLAFLEQPLTANLSWNGGRLAIDKATAKDSSISGFIDINAEGLTNLKNPLAAITNLRLNVGVKNLDIQSLPLQLPDNIAQVNYGGKLDFDGQVSGTPLSLVLDGEVGLNGFHLESLNFADMSGTVNLNPRDGLNLELLAEDGRKQQIQLSLDKQYSPLAFNFQHENMKATGRKEKQSLLVSTQNIDISLLKDFATKSLPETVSKEKIAGKMSGDFLFNFNNYSLVGKNVVIVNPTFGNLKGEILTARFQYIDGHLALSEGQLKNKQSIYQIDGSLSQTKAGPIVQGKVEVASAQIQDVLGTLQIFELEDFSRFANGFKPPHYDKVAALYQQDNRTENKAKDSPLFSVGSPEAPILNQLRRLTEIEQLKLINEQKRRDKSPLPELADLRGMFQGSMSVSGNLARGFSDIKVGFNFAGKDWQWGDHKANLVAAKGSLQEGILRLDPIQIQSDNSLLYLAGSLGEKTLSGELEIANLPVDKIQEFVDLPDLIGFGGLIDARIVLGGSKDNPVGRGEITVSDATINNTSVQSAQGSFSYSNSRLQFFASSVLANNSPPLTVSGSLPLPVSNFRAKSDDLNLKLSMKDSGLAMLNILTRDNIQWLDGKGNVDLNISGKINQKTFLPYQLRAEGMTTLENATIAAKFIPNAPLTEIKGKILFDFDDINVESLEGKFSGGKVKVGGTIPLIEDIPQANPLTVSLDNLAFNLKGIYQGGVKGDIQIKGTALYPNLGGQVELFNGKIFLSENVNGNGDSGIGANTDFDNLQLKLERDIFISAPPVLEFAAIGDLKVNGTLNKPLPQGTINLKRGQVNLFTSQLYLVSGHKNTAQFFAQNGLDPYLDVRLIGTATETAGKPIASDPNSSEISDRSSFSNANVGSLETIRILAEVNGFASQLANSIELKSSPPRNKTEIVALLGGDFANTLGRGDTTLGLANLAGQAFFNSFQNQIAEALGLSDFRIFPTQVIDSNERTESLALGMELGVNITSDLSVSAMKILTQDISPQVGIRYRINDNTVIRGSSDFDRDTRGVLEYQKRF